MPRAGDPCPVPRCMRPAGMDMLPWWYDTSSWARLMALCLRAVVRRPPTPPTPRLGPLCPSPVSQAWSPSLAAPPHEAAGCSSSRGWCCPAACCPDLGRGPPPSPAPPPGPDGREAPSPCLAACCGLPLPSRPRCWLPVSPPAAWRPPALAPALGSLGRCGGRCFCCCLAGDSTLPGALACCRCCWWRSPGRPGVVAVPSDSLSESASSPSALRRWRWCCAVPRRPLPPLPPPSLLLRDALLPEAAGCERPLLPPTRCCCCSSFSSSSLLLSVSNCAWRRWCLEGGCCLGWGRAPLRPCCCWLRSLLRASLPLAAGCSCSWLLLSSLLSVSAGRTRSRQHTG